MTTATAERNHSTELEVLRRSFHCPDVTDFIVIEEEEVVVVKFTFDGKTHVEISLGANPRKPIIVQFSDRDQIVFKKSVSQRWFRKS